MDDNQQQYSTVLCDFSRHFIGSIIILSPDEGTIYTCRTRVMTLAVLTLPDGGLH